MPNESVLKDKIITITLFPIKAGLVIINENKKLIIVLSPGQNEESYKDDAATH